MGGSPLHSSAVKTEVEALDNNMVKLSVEVDEGEFEQAVDDAFRRIAREVRIPGFRPGKAPRRLLEAKLGADFAREEALRESLPDYYATAVRDHAVDAIAAPEIDITGGERDGPLAFDAVVEVRPQIEVSGYEDLTVTIPSPVPTDAELDDQIDRLRGQSAQLEEVARPATDGDNLTIDIHGSHEGEPVAGLTADDYLYEIGTSGIVDEVDNQLRGAKVGDILDFSAPHPDADEAPLHFRILVKEVKAKILPDVDDDWASEASEFDTVDELRADIRKRIAGVKVLQSRMALRDRTARALADLVTDPIPDALVEHELQHRLEDFLLRLKAQGVELADYLGTTGQTQDDLVAEMRTAAAEVAKVDLALRSVGEAEGIEVTDDDIESELVSAAAQMDEDPDELRRQFTDADQVPAVRSDLRKRKTLDWLVERVQIVDTEGDPIDRSDLEPPEPDDNGGEGGNVIGTSTVDNPDTSETET